MFLGWVNDVASNQRIFGGGGVERERERGERVREFVGASWEGRGGGLGP
jgi:hypothetical protein